MKFSFKFKDGLRADQVLADGVLKKMAAYAKEDVEKTTEIFEKPAGLRIPTTMQGHFVGWAELHEDGTLTVEAEDTPEGRELWKLIVQGTANCISVGPNPIGPIIRSDGGL